MSDKEILSNILDHLMGVAESTPFEEYVGTLMDHDAAVEHASIVTNLVAPGVIADVAIGDIDSAASTISSMFLTGIVVGILFDQAKQVERIDG